MRSGASRWATRGRTGSAQAGFTLVEIVVASVLLATTIVGVLGTYSATARALGVSQFNSMAARLAQTKMADLRSQQPLQIGDSSGDFGEDYQGYTWSASVQQVTNLTLNTSNGTQTLDGLYQIDLTITGPASGRTRDAKFATYVLGLD